LGKRFQIADFRLLISDISDFRFQIQIADSDFRFQISFSKIELKSESVFKI